jgi:tetratricopeptide (TPR) repeat protein
MKADKSFFRVFRLLPVMLLAVCISGCATIGGMGFVKSTVSDMALPTINDLVDNGLRSDDLVVLQSMLEADLVLLETLARNSPDNLELNALVSKLYGYYGFGFVVIDEYEDVDDAVREKGLERARNLYWHGIDYGMKALKTNRNFRKALEKGAPIKEAVKYLRKKDLPAAYGTAFNMGLNLICSLDVPQVLAMAEDFVDLTDWILETDETIEYGTTHVLLGVYYAIMPAVGGGGPDKALAEFKKAIEIEPNFLINHFFYARYYPTLLLEEDLFDREINYILDYSVDDFPAVRALNKVAQRKAADMKANRDYYF